MRAYPTGNRGYKGWPLARGVAAYGGGAGDTKQVAAAIGSSLRTAQRKVKRMRDGVCTAGGLLASTGSDMIDMGEVGFYWTCFYSSLNSGLQDYGPP